ncbi:hypothetical protein C8F01DRAFT_1360437 [Mycena amicta]|nr:hypothetical protein C8F01DRAFT_1360437 [Mycena amicta]
MPALDVLKLTSTPTLFTPLTLGSTTIPNRVGLSALTRGAGLIVTEGVLITRQGTEWQEAPGLWDQSQIDGWKTIVETVHATGRKIYSSGISVASVIQRRLSRFAARVPVYAPSAISARGGKLASQDMLRPRNCDPKTVIAQFKQAAINAKAAGFRRFHGANGYLIHQFLDSTSNHCTDASGGSPATRARFALQTLAASQEVYGPDVSIKLKTENLPVPFSYVTLVRYNAFTDPEVDGKPRATKHDVLEMLTGYLAKGKRLVFVNSGVQPAEAAELISSGKVARVFFGLNWLAHPDLARRSV